MRLLMVTRADESVASYTRYTHPILKRFAEKWGAEFKILDAPLKIHGCWKILELYNLFEDYDRILHIDSDIVINKNCPNIFDIVSYDVIGLIFEDKGSRLENRRSRIRKIRQRFRSSRHWISGYFNMGIFLASKVHRDMFTKIYNQLWMADTGLEQTHLNYQMREFEYKHVDLGYKFNHMSMFSEAWNGSPSRFNSHIIHYAGKGNFPDKDNRTIEQLIKDDIIRIYGMKVLGHIE